MAESPKAVPAKTTAAMKKKANRKLLIIIGSFVLIGAVAVGGLAYLRISGAPERNARQGETALAEGDALLAAGQPKAANEKYRSAVDRIGRSVHDVPNNLGYVDKMIGALGHIVPETGSEAAERYRQLLQLMERRTVAAKRDPKVWNDYIDSLREHGRVTQRPEVWGAMAEAATRMKERLDADSPGQEAAELAYAEAQSNRTGAQSEDERARVEAALQAILATHGGEPRAWGALLRVQQERWNRLNEAGRDQEAASLRQIIDEGLAKASAQIPGTTALMQARLRLAMRPARGEKLDNAVIQAALDALLESGIASSDPWDLHDAAAIQATAGTPDQCRRAAAALQSYLATHPQALLHQRALGMLQANFDSESARATFESLVKSPQLPVGLVSAIQDEIRVDSIERLFNLAYADSENADSDAARTAALEGARAARSQAEVLLRGRGGEGTLKQFDGMLAYADKDYAKAAGLLSSLITQDPEVGAEIYFTAAASEANLAEYGAALMLAERGLERHGPSTPLLLVMAQLQLRLGRNREAAKVLEFVLAEDPENTAALAMAKVATTPSMTDFAPAQGTADPIVGVVSEAEVLYSRGDRAGAQAALEAAEAKGADVRLRRAIVQCVVAQGDQSQIAAAFDAALLAYPGDPVLQSMRTISTTDDPVERAVRLHAEAAHDAAAKASADYIALRSLESVTRARIDTAKAAGLPAPAGSEAIMTSIQGRLAAAEAKAIAGDGRNPPLIEMIFDAALAEKDSAARQRALDLAAKCIDPTLPDVLLGKEALTSGDYVTASAKFLTASAAPGASGNTFRLLGVARERSGDVPGALAAFSEAYRRRPNDPATIEGYGRLLGRGGEPARALEVVRAGAAALPGNTPIVNLWLELEAEFGNKLQALETRRRHLLQRPADRENARALVVLLAEVPPHPEMIVGADGKPKYSASEWVSMPREQQIELLMAIRAQNLQQAQEEAATLLEKDPGNLMLATRFAGALYRTGEQEAAEKVMRDFIAAAPDSVKPLAWFELGVQLLGRSDRPGAQSAFETAVKLQAPGTFDASLAIADFWFLRGDWTRASEALNPVVQATNDLSHVRRQAELQIRMQEFDKARATIARGAQLAGKPSAVDTNLSAALSQAEAQAAWLAGDQPKALAAIAQMDQALEAAIKLEPGDPSPYLLRASARSDQFARTGDPRAMQEALAAARRCVELRGGLWVAVRLLADLLATNGDAKGAVEVLQRYVTLSPRHFESRRLFADILAESGKVSMGLATLQSAANDDPTNVRWLDAIAQYSARHGRGNEGAQALERAYDMESEQMFLVRAVQMRQSQEPFDARALIQALESRPAALGKMQFLNGALAGARARLGEREGGLETLRQFLRTAELEPGSFDGWMENVRSAFAPDKMAECERFVLDCAGADPPPALLAALADQWLGTGTDGYSRAKEFAVRAAAAPLPDATATTRVFTTLATANLLMGDCGAARVAFQKALDSAPDNPQLINNLAYLEATCGGDAEKAVALCNRAIEMVPTQPEFIDTLGVALMARGDYAQAQNYLLRSLRNSPTASKWLHLAQAQAKVGAKAEAIRSIAQARSMKPDAATTAELDALEGTLSAPAK